MAVDNPGWEERVDSSTDSLRERIKMATRRLAVTTAMLTDAEVREPSLLPGWSRGHLLTHVARNADGLRNLLVWARTGVETPMYPGREARQEGIEAGAGRTAAELAEDVRQSAAGFAEEAAGLPASAWDVPVRGGSGPAHPAWLVLFRRLSEVEVHHADLGLGYGPADWPAAFVADELELVTGQFAERDDAPACVLQVAGTRQRVRLGPASADRTAAEVTVAGPAWSLLAWLIGRDAGAGLSVTGPASPGQEPADGRPRLPPKLPEWS
jgi:maleylpyruvate isomerase